MKDNSAFLEELRNEIAASQLRRHQHIRAKVVFLISFLSLGGVANGNLPTEPLLYLTTVVVLIFDLYILGENFGIKRAGAFIRHSPAAPGEAVRWEKAVIRNRDPFSAAANFLSSVLVVAAATWILIQIRSPGLFVGPWFLASLLVLGVLAGLQVRMGRKLRRFEDYLESDGSELRVEEALETSHPGE